MKTQAFFITLLDENGKYMASSIVETETREQAMECARYKWAAFGRPGDGRTVTAKTAKEVGSK